MQLTARRKVLEQFALFCGQGQVGCERCYRFEIELADFQFMLFGTTRRSGRVAMAGRGTRQCKALLGAKGKISQGQRMAMGAE